MALENHKLKGRVLLESQQDLSPSKNFNPFEFKPEHPYVLKLDEDSIEEFKNIQSIIIDKIMPIVENNKRNGKDKHNKKGRFMADCGLQSKFEREDNPKKIAMEFRLSENDDYISFGKSLDYKDVDKSD